MSPQKKTFTFAIPDAMKATLRAIRERDGISEAEQIRRGIQLWINTKGGTGKTERKRAVTRRRS
jgi:hypothetical protein